MSYFVYLIISKNPQNKLTSYVGYTNDLHGRLHKHNNNKGAKSTKGHKWYLIYKKKYKTKSLAMINEYKLKNDRTKRIKIKNKFTLKMAIVSI